MIFITCALHCEAKPLIEKYRLVADREARFTIFHRDEITLVVTGVGKVLMASAMTYVYARYQEPENSTWLNVGIAGKKESELGDCYNINKVTEHSSGTNWYPARLLNLSEGKSCGLISMDKPTEYYSQSSAHDMEASAFMATALRFSSVEFLQILKIVSDTDENRMQDIDKKMVSKLILNKVMKIDELVLTLLSMSTPNDGETWEVDAYEQCCHQWHFSEYQKKALIRLLQQWKALDEKADIHVLYELQNGKQVITSLTNKIENIEITFEEKND